MKKPLFVLLITVLSACSDGSYTENVSLHPITENMPHPDIEPVILETSEPDNFLEKSSENIQLLHRFLQGGPVNDRKMKLNLLTTGNLDISSLNDSTLLILEKDNDRLIQYNVNRNEYEVVAEQGRGPVDLFFSEDLTIHNDMAYIAMQGFQISVFNCEASLCEHEKIIETDYNNYSVALHDDYILFLGMATFGREQSPDPANTKQSLIYKIDNDGNLLDSFSSVYRFRSPILRDRLNSGGTVNIYPSYNTILVTMEYFPYIYEYDSDGKLKQKYELPKFQQSFHQYSEKTRGVAFLNRGNNSSIKFTKKLNEQLLLIGLKERRNVEWISREEGFTGDEWISYYIFNIKDRHYYHLGDDSLTDQPYSGKERVIHVVDQGVIVNDLGTLYIIKNSNES